ncbi:hypothetical protein Plhal304r1_c039g0115931 [Plasmopara halstedii]
MPILPLIQWLSRRLGQWVQLTTPTRCVAEHTDVKRSTRSVDRGVDTLALDAIKSAG